VALFGPFWHFFAPFGTLFCGGAWKTEEFWQKDLKS
jgi:hypothetical protein